MITKLCNENRITLNLINDTMFSIDPAGPETRESMPEGFWFSDAFIWSALYIAYE